MVYSIGEVAEKMGLSIHTLRYYDKIGILPLVERSENGRRMFTDKDLIMLNTIECLKKTGMQLKDIKQYIDWCAEGASTTKQRFDLFAERKRLWKMKLPSCKRHLRLLIISTSFIKRRWKRVTLTPVSWTRKG